ncbi:MAG: metalloregulator ArsR/SmtB family transcription factor [Acidobacteria bacterium]|nr:metalloregulator ArsR/SmtB family transcription factor [Acidobacteriota bacterium]
MAKLFAVFAHPDRVRIIEELGGGEKDVNSIQAVLGVSHSRTSQNLAILRTNRVVIERRDGRRVFYRLAQPELAKWALDGLRFIAGEAEASGVRMTAIEEARQIWEAEQSEELLLANRD